MGHKFVSVFDHVYGPQSCFPFLTGVIFCPADKMFPNFEGCCPDISHGSWDNECEGGLIKQDCKSRAKLCASKFVL